MSNNCNDDGQDAGFEPTEEQKHAFVTGHNLAVTAGAGTGKTTTLKERYRHILHTEPETSPEALLTLTFTNDATNELREEIRALVDEELATAGDEDYSRWRQAKDDLEDAYVHTIHGFCSRVLREFAVEAGIHPDFETLDESDAATLIDEAITKVLDRHAVGEEDEFTPEDGVHSMDRKGSTDWSLEAAITTISHSYPRYKLEATLLSLFGERPDSTTWADRWADTSPEAYRDFCSQFVEGSFTRKEADELVERQAIQDAIDELLELREIEYEFAGEGDDGLDVLRELTNLLSATGAHEPDGAAVDRQRFLVTAANAVTSGGGSLYSRAHYYAGSKGRWADYGREDERQRLKDALDTITDCIDPESRNLDHDPVRAQNAARQAVALARIFKSVHSEYESLKERQNALDYADLITKAIEFLYRHEPARTELCEQFEYIMVDEAQDTDPRQWDLVKLLSGDDPDRFDGENVFIVGDEKQSIYRFRDADVTQFRAGREALLAAAPETAIADIDLSGSFRTVEPTLTVINELFEEVLKPAALPEDGGEDYADTQEETTPESETAAEFELTEQYESYEASPQWLDSMRKDGTEVEGFVEYLVTPKDEEADVALGLEDSWFTADPFVTDAQREATAVASRLTQIFADEVSVYDPEEEHITSAQPRHVALLFRSGQRMTAFERALEDADIPYTNMAGEGFYSTPEIRPLINLLRVLEDPQADIPLYGVLRSPLFGFTDSVIASARQPDATLWKCLGNADGELARAREQLIDWRRQVGLRDGDGTLGFGRWSTLLSNVIDETGYFVSIGADERPQQAIANVEKFREQLRRWEEGNARSIAALLERIDQAQSGGDDPSEASIPGAVDGVQLRTIHSAKGLEFPIVIVPEMTREFNLQSSLNGAHFERLNDVPVLGMKAPRSDPFVASNSGTYLRVRKERRQRERAEARRVLYVAATRARDHLIFSGLHAVDPDTETGLKVPGDWDEADSWRDWVQPSLLAIPGLVTTLATEREHTAQLDAGEYEIRRPTPPGDWSPAKEDTTIPADLTIPAPQRQPQRDRRTVTAFGDQILEVPREDRPAMLRVRGGASEGTESADKSPPKVEQLDEATFGTVVHKICELDPPEEDWPEIIRRCVDDPAELTDLEIDAIKDHARSGLSALEAIGDGREIRSRHAEHAVTLTLPSAQISGTIDHLVTTEDGYLVVDFKTSDVTENDRGTVTEEYLPQLLAYAGALIQNDESTAMVDIAIVYTGSGDIDHRRLPRETVNEFLEWAETIL